MTSVNDEEVAKGLMASIINLERENIRTANKNFGQMVTAIKTQIKKEVEPLIQGNKPTGKGGRK